MPRRLLLTLIFLRLLWPPGVCLCHYFDREPAHHDHDDHLPGCPGSKVAAVALCAMKPEPPSTPDLSAVACLLPSADVVKLAPVAAFPEPPADEGRPLDQPLYLTLRALLI